MKKFYLPLLLPLVMMPLASQAATYTKVVGTLVPDYPDLSGLSSTITVSGDTTAITGVQVVLDLSGTQTAGWSGDIYCYVIHNSVVSVLLNRIGRTSTNLAGNGNNSMVLTLSDGATTDVHAATPPTGALVGTFLPDGRAVDPSVSLDTTPRTASLGVFNTGNSNGDWTLFVSDAASGGTMTLNSWQLTINPVPEPSVAGLGVLGLASLVMRRRRR